MNNLLIQLLIAYAATQLTLLRTRIILVGLQLTQHSESDLTITRPTAYRNDTQPTRYITRTDKSLDLRQFGSPSLYAPMLIINE